MIERGLDSGGETNRFVIKDQKLYMTERKSKSKWGDSKRWYFALGLLELIEIFGREVPDVDVVINGEDYPLSSDLERYATGKVLNKNKSKKRAVSRRKWSDSKLGAPPIVFSIARREGFVDIPWPQNNIWGMDWKGMGMRERPWCVEFKNLMKKSCPFSARHSKVFWRGQMRSN
jgi:hypothetical protein